jgi:hypothetical protein
MKISIADLRKKVLATFADKNFNETDARRIAET